MSNVGPRRVSDDDVLVLTAEAGMSDGGNVQFQMQPGGVRAQELVEEACDDACDDGCRSSCGSSCDDACDDGCRTIIIVNSTEDELTLF